MRIREKLLRSIFFENLSVVHKQNSVADLACKAHFVGNNDHCHTLLGKFSHNLKHLAYHLRVKGTCRLIKKNDIGIHGKRAHYCNTLLLTAGKLGRIHIGLIGKPYSVEKLKSIFMRFLFYLLSGLDGFFGIGFAECPLTAKLSHSAFLTKHG